MKVRSAHNHILVHSFLSCPILSYHFLRLEKFRIQHCARLFSLKLLRNLNQYWSNLSSLELKGDAFCEVIYYDHCPGCSRGNSPLTTSVELLLASLHCDFVLIRKNVHSGQSR